MMNYAKDTLRTVSMGSGRWAVMVEGQQVASFTRDHHGNYVAVTASLIDPKPIGTFTTKKAMLEKVLI